MLDDITFSVNDHDSDGDVSEEGIYIHIGPMRLHVGEDLHDFDEFVEKLQRIRRELAENYFPED